MREQRQNFIRRKPDETSHDDGGLGQGGYSRVGGKWPGLASELLEWKDRN